MCCIGTDIMEPEVSTPTSLPTSLRFRCSNMLVPGQWHHLAVVMSKDVKKSCVTSVYFNGKAFGSGKVLTKIIGRAVYYTSNVWHSSQLFHLVSDEVYPAVPRSVCLHGPHGCNRCVWNNRHTSFMEGTRRSCVASRSYLLVGRGFEP